MYCSFQTNVQVSPFQVPVFPTTTGTKIDKTNKPFIVKQKCVPVPIISKVDKQTISFHEIKKKKIIISVDPVRNKSFLYRSSEFKTIPRLGMTPFVESTVLLRV